MTALPVGKGEMRRDGVAAHAPHRDPRVRQHAAAGARPPAEELDATVANMRFVKPLDVELVARLAREHDALVTVEENVVAGGAGSAVAEALAARGHRRFRCCSSGCPTRSSTTATRRSCSRECGLDATGIAASIVARFGAAAGGDAAACASAATRQAAAPTR